MDYYDITNEQYEEILAMLNEAIGGASFYSGKISGLFSDGVEWEFSLTAYIHWDDYHIVPIWWAFDTSNDGEVFNNDFSFDKMKQLWLNAPEPH